MTTIALGIVVFTGVILALVLLLLAADAAVVGGGTVRVEVDEHPERSFTTTAGQSLLSALTAHEVFLPSACGGRGTCGVCKVRVLEGGGALGPTETAHVTRAEARNGIRLACQMKLREDSRVAVPEEVLGTRKWMCRVRAARNVATFIREVVLELEPGDHMPFKPGSYVQVHVPPGTVHFRDFLIEPEFRPDWERFGFFALSSTVLPDEDLYRAYSLANDPGEDTILRLNVRIATPPPSAPNAPPGKASAFLFSLTPGDRVTVSGPYGTFFLKESDAEMVYIGGGAGMAPLRSHIFELFHRRQTTRRVSYWYGARSLREAYYEDEFRALAAAHDNFTFHVALSEPLPEDHWDGPTGFIHQVVLDEYLRDHPAPEDVDYYLCGPPLMLRACLAMLSDLGVEPDHIAYDEF